MWLKIQCLLDKFNRREIGYIFIFSLSQIIGLDGSQTATSGPGLHCLPLIKQFLDLLIGSKQDFLKFCNLSYGD